MNIVVDREICQDLDRAVRREWLETNGIGGFAGSTIVGMNTRRYHGLFVPATHPPVGRFVAVSSLQETVHSGDAAYELGCNRYAGAVHPEGYRHLEQFRLDPYPVFRYRVEDAEIEKHVFMVHGENTTAVVHGPVSHALVLEIRPLIAFRDYHHLASENADLNGDAETSDGAIRLHPYADLPPLYIAYSGGEYDPSSYWYYGFEYSVEAYRGLDNREDLFSPGCLRFSLEPGESASLILSLSPTKVEDFEAMRQSEIDRRRRTAASVSPGDSTVEALSQAADTFVVQRRDGLSTVIAGYPWFSDWGRDTMISLPGLTLVTGRFSDARAILEAFGRACDQGMIPNRYPDHGWEADYNSVDATLWYIYAVDRYRAYTDDLSFIWEHLWPVLTEIIDWFCRGTRYDIHLDGDGLLYAGEPGVQLTWMDAKVGDWVVTPRIGKPVEINALWYHALRVVEGLARRFGEPDQAEAYGRLAGRTAARFSEAFWNDSAGCLYDTVDAHHRNPEIRPNQIFALSLPSRMLSEDQERRVLEVVERELLTPVGLRSLAPGSSGYRGHYGGDQVSRDSAYHQGTVWAWLIGPFVTAWVRIHGATEDVRQEAVRFVEPLREHLHEAGLGQISEIFDGDAPHEPRGCTAQAWSVAEVLRAYVEDILGRRPKGDIEGSAG